ncbi:MAG: cupin domain-containing protein [Candidatus Thorarchaeota archaeon]|jgi:mannose-6-phosphate isomerase-like protein (cupin superfamily)
MLVKELDDCKEIVALDDSIIRELLNPLHDQADLKLNYSLAHATVKPGKATLPHRFKTASEVYYILKGRGIMHINDQSADVGPGATIYIPPMAIQYVENKSQEDLEFLCIVYPSWQPDAEELV